MPDLVFSGNEIRVVINGVEVELAQNVRMSDGYGHEGASGIGDIHIKEHVPSVARHTVTMSKIVMKKEQAVQAGMVLQNGDEAMEGREFDIEVFEKPNQSGGGGGLIKKTLACVNDGGDITVSAHRMVMADATFLGRDTRGTYATRA